jgi:hypothetical protein
MLKNWLTCIKKQASKEINRKHTLGFKANDRQVERKRGENTEKLDPPSVKHVFVNFSLTSPM